MRRLTLAYLKTEQGSGLVLAAAAALALLAANSPYGHAYEALLARPIPVRLDAFAETLTFADWVRAFLMPVFFLVLGMQLKFELLRGELSNPRRLALPALAALGGLVGPTLVFASADAGWPRDLPVWAASLGTDGAVALAALALAARRPAHSLRVLLISVALADDLAAAVIAAILSPGRLHLAMLVGMGATLAILALLSRWRRAPFFFYAAGFVAVWAFALKSGLDASLAGIACAFVVPIGARRPGQDSTLKYFMDSLHPYVAFAVLPLFVFTAAGVSVREIEPAALVAAPARALGLALMLGKPLGIFGFCAGAAALKIARRPSGAAWDEILAVAILSGAGFTVSWFLAGVTGAASPPVRATIFIASAAPALAGAGLLAWTQTRRLVAAEAPA
jgi:NhaA family Na+:H+ antiporter